MKTLRFKRKTFGRGRTPSSRQGRITTMLYIILMISRSERFQTTSQNNPALKAPYDIVGFDDEGNLLVFLTPVIILTLLLLIICYRKGETPKWQWGGKENK